SPPSPQTSGWPPTSPSSSTPRRSTASTRPSTRWGGATTAACGFAMSALAPRTTSSSFPSEPEMGLFTALVTLPLAPVRGVAWVADHVAQEAERQLTDPTRLRGELLQLEFDRDQGLIGEEEFAARAEEVLQRIAA